MKSGDRLAALLYFNISRVHEFQMKFQPSVAKPGFQIPDTPATHDRAQGAAPERHAVERGVAR